MFSKFKSRWRDFLEQHPDFADNLAFYKSTLPPINFITIHWFYFIVMTLVFSGIFYGANTADEEVPFIDCLFLVTSAITDTGLNTVNLSQLNTFQQVILMLLFILGSPHWISFWTVMARKSAFEKRFDHIVEAEREARKRIRAANAANTQTGPTLREFLSFDRYRSSSQADDDRLPGLGTRQPATEMQQIPESTEFVPTPLRRTPREGPQELEKDTPADAEVNDTVSRATTLASDVPAPVTTDHIAFAELLPAPLITNSGRATTSAYSPRHQPVQRQNGRRPSSTSSHNSEESEDILDHWRRLLKNGRATKRGQFYDLTSDERDVLGGCEYRALKVLVVLVPCYGFFIQLFSGIALGAWLAINASNRTAVNHQNPWWTGFFLSVSAFNNAGLSLLDANMIPFNKDWFPLAVVAFNVLAGNTAYPLFLRLIIWTSSKIIGFVKGPDTSSPLKDTLDFILKYPRRVYTTLFNSVATWWLTGVLLITNVTDWLGFEIFNIGNPLTEQLSLGTRMMDGLFQAIVVRAAGFAVISISGLYPATQLLYTIMMYISVYPVTVTMRHTNIYEERSLGIYDHDSQPHDPEMGDMDDPLLSPTRNRLRRVATGATTWATNGAKARLKRAMTFHGVGARPAPAEDNSRVSFITQQIRNQLAHDLWWLVLPLLGIVIVETGHFKENPIQFSFFNILIETVSGYANVGLSVGVPDNSYSFSGSWRLLSKLLLVAIMLRGRHRGLPVALDKAIRLPGEKLGNEEEEDQRIRTVIAREREFARNSLHDD